MSQSAIGLFPVSYRIGTSASGAPTLMLNLLVNTPQHSVIGTAHIGQAVNPPVNVHSDVKGQYTYMTVMPPNDSRILITAQGRPFGANPHSETNFSLHLVLDHDWQKGVASYRYFNGGHWVEVENAPARINKELKSDPAILTREAGAGVNPVPSAIVLYGAPIQSAIASGDLARMKSLAALARQQLDSQPQLRKQLEKLKTEIGKLEHR
ncbi:DUF1842 domain-containing protein [Paludibacterium paludis]|uniref:DUF1842 domain-containing protein n=1 Tax=Paludibacterium paludis TaxID=1225769 RepID=A0A918P439_9NEIS|nr:DUF1842 domain-containing protein [Paludibacterium paludis]GGY19768.1 hypothetical protein GCM10011289_24010 [Paludibacterium paludis]